MLYSFFTQGCRKNSTTIVLVVIILANLIFAPGASAGKTTNVPIHLTPTYGTVTNVSNYPPLGIPELTWGKVEGAKKYRVQISPDIGFAVIPINLTTTNTSYTHNDLGTNLLYDGNWYWRVRSDDPVSEYSQAMMFVKEWASIENSPVLVSPSNSVSLSFFDAPTFSWKPVIGAARYRLQIATSEDGFAAPIYNQFTLSNSHQPVNKLSNGVYYWRVIPVDPGDNLGTSSVIRSFTVEYSAISLGNAPILLEPLHDSEPIFTPTFKWSAVRGAEKYRLEYTSAPNCNFGTGATVVETRNTTYTPTSTLPNDQNFCWRVRALSGQSIGEWSETWQFVKAWYIKPQLLTPTNNFKYGIYPFFSWTPVPGASYYRIEVDKKEDLTNPYQAHTTANPFFTMREYEGSPGVPYFWRVRPFDGNGKEGDWSEIFSFTSYYTATVPTQIYPFYYYSPNSFPPPYNDIRMDPFEDRTVALPIFMWHRVLNPNPTGGIYSPAYRIEVDLTPAFSPPIWSFDTENTSASPTLINPFTPDKNAVYYWRVCPLNSIGGTCMQNPENGDIWWSQIWRTKIDTTLATQATGGLAPTLTHPAHGDIFVDATPRLQWMPYSNANSYRIQISRDQTFNETPLIDAQTPYPVYTPQVSLAQRSLGKTDYGTFYWRIIGLQNGSPVGSWSDPRRFQIASQSDWKLHRDLGDLNNQVLIAYDEYNDVPANFDLSGLYASQSEFFWFFGFDIHGTTSNMTYALYLDIDYKDNSGADFDARQDSHGFNVSTIAAHKPEYAIYIDQIDGEFSREKTFVYKWEGNNWGHPVNFTQIADADINPTSDYIELKIPITAIGLGGKNTASVSLFSINSTGGFPVDTSPSDPTAASGVLSRFSAVSDRLNLLAPPNTLGGSQDTISFVPPFFWDYPTGSNEATPYAGATIEVHLDPSFTNPAVGNINITSNTKYFAQPNASWVNDLRGDNTYYWRVRPRYLPSVVRFGAWSEGWSFERDGLMPKNLSESINFATPTFSWDMVEGASSYDLWVDNDPNFGSREVDINTTQASYTPTNTLPEGTYYWKVRARRHQVNQQDDWSEVKTFTLSLPKPGNLRPNLDASTAVGYAPTLCWDPVVVNTNGVPVLAAWKYRVHVSKSPGFSTLYDDIVTEQACWTPTKGYEDGSFYWRVAIIDGNNRLGSFSETAQFTKQYPVTTLSSPVSGSVIAFTPTFKWQPVFNTARYRLEVSLSPTYSPIYDSITTVSTSFNPIKIYDLNKTYYWRVAIIDKDGRTGPFTDALIILDPFPGSIKLFLPMITRP
jgi:hypothetical protein